MAWNWQKDDTDLSDVLGRYSWVWKDEEGLGQTFIKVNDGSLTLELRDSSSPASPENITGELYFGDVVANIKFFQLHTHRTSNEPTKSHWRYHLEVHDDCDDRKALEQENGEHNLNVLKDLDDCGRPFLLVELNFGYEGFMEMVVTLLAKRWDEGKSWKPSRRELRLIKLLTDDDDNVDGEDETEADEEEEEASVVDGTGVAAEEDSTTGSKEEGKEGAKDETEGKEIDKTAEQMEGYGF